MTDAAITARGVEVVRNFEHCCRGYVEPAADFCAMLKVPPPLCEGCQANATVIAAALCAVRDETLFQVEPYMQHKGGCATHWKEACTCGLDAIRHPEQRER